MAFLFVLSLKGGGAMEGANAGNRKTTTRFLCFAVLAAGVALVFLLNLGVGVAKIELSEIARILFGVPLEGDTNFIIIQRIRLPRALASLAGGASLAISGLLLQTYFANPIIEPYILGVTSGSTLFVGLVMLGGFTFGLPRVTPLFLFGGAFLGAMLIMAVILFAAGRVKSVVTLLIIGLMAGYVCGAATSILSAYAEKQRLTNFVMWNMGSFSGFTWAQIRLMYGATLPMLAVSCLMAKPLNILSMGDQYAHSMGVNVKATRYGIIVVSSVLVAATTAFAGPVSFIGLAAPHICRIIFQTSNNRLLIPASILGGGLLSGFCDFVARNIVSPMELPLGSITSVIGAPLVVFLLMRKEKL
ncbi:MAG: iron ABC transporter permease [Treponema sp.]|jgi:iron complex transport system permease protein|nr:iron ABC transporter permease [Treponema sp.]